MHAFFGSLTFVNGLPDTHSPYFYFEKLIPIEPASCCKFAHILEVSLHLRFLLFGFRQGFA